MRALLAATAMALVAGTFAGCSSNDIGRGGPREDWNKVETDPVCRQTVNPKTAYTYTYEGKRYYFETEECARKFRDNPTAYVTPGDQRTEEERRHHRDVR